MKSLLCCVCVAAVLMTASADAGESKIAVVDVVRLVKAHPKTDTDKRIIEEQVREFEAEHEKRIEDFTQMKEDFAAAREEAMNKALSEEGREQKMKVAEEKMIALRERERELRETVELRRQQISDQRIRMRKRILTQLRGMTQEYAKKNGYSLVLDSSGAGLNGVTAVVYAADNIDITAKLLDAVKALKVD